MKLLNLESAVDIVRVASFESGDDASGNILSPQHESHRRCKELAVAGPMVHQKVLNRIETLFLPLRRQ